MAFPRQTPSIQRSRSPFAAAGVKPQVLVHGDYYCSNPQGASCASGCMAGTGKDENAAYQNAYQLSNQQCQSSPSCHLTNFTQEGSGGCS